MLKSQGPPSGPGDVKKVNIDRLGERILADYSIGLGAGQNGVNCYVCLPSGMGMKSPQILGSSRI